MMRLGSGGYIQNFKSIRQKLNISILGDLFGGALGARGLDCSQYQILTDPHNGLKNPNMNFGNYQSHSLGGVC